MYTYSYNTWLAVGKKLITDVTLSRRKCPPLGTRGKFTNYLSSSHIIRIYGVRYTYTSSIICLSINLSHLTYMHYIHTVVYTSKSWIILMDVRNNDRVRNPMCPIIIMYHNIPTESEPPEDLRDISVDTANVYLKNAIATNALGIVLSEFRLHYKITK